jgi:hypothetical protein
MQSEDLDKKIVEAAENHHPVYDEKGWAVMETLLDKHLPQEGKRRRRFLLWWILPVILAGSVWLIVQLPKNKGRVTTVINKETGTTVAQKNNNTPAVNSTDDQTAADAVPPVSANNSADPVKNTGTGNETVTSEKTTSVNLPVVTEKGNEKTKGDITALSTKNNYHRTVPGNSNVKTRKLTTGLPDKDKTAGIKDKTDGDTKKADGDPLIDIAAGAGNIKKRAVQQQNEQPGIIPEKEKNKTGDPVTEKVAINKPEEIKTPGKPDSVSQMIKKETAKTKTNSKKKKLSSFFFSLSAGPDISYVSSNKAGSVKMVLGAGIGYNYKDKFTLRTGFYTGRKVYSASADAYHAPPAFNQFYPYLQKVDANCKVYEIPVSLSYNFGKKSSPDWFVSAGLSSFLMKEETYNYFYKYTPTGNTFTNKWTIKNENYHFFSVATLSGGYKKSISKRVSIMAEPYIKIPLGGVGYGKVKLNSGGVLFTVGIKAF